MLTQRQKELVEFIAAETKRRGGVAPSRREMARYLGMRSAGPITAMIDACIERGALVKIPHRARAVALRGKGERVEWHRFDDDTKTLVRLDENGGGSS